MNLFGLSFPNIFAAIDPQEFMPPALALQAVALPPTTPSSVSTSTSVQALTPIPTPVPTPTPTVTPTQPTLTDQQAQVTQQKGITTGATGFTVAPPPVTVNDPAVSPVVKQAQTDATTAQTDLGTANTNIKSTQDQIDTLSKQMSDGGVSAAQIQYLQVLQNQLAQQQTAAQSAQGRLNTANATVAAGNTVLYQQQAQTDLPVAQTAQTNADQAYTTLTTQLQGSPVPPPNRDKGGTLSSTQIDQLTPKQLDAYNQYVAAQNTANQGAAKVNADMANANQSWAQLQVYASDPQYGTAANDAITTMNTALAPSGMQMQGPDPIDPAKANQQLYDAIYGSAGNPGTLMANAAYDATGAIVGNAGVQQNAKDAQTTVNQAQAAVDAYQKQHRVNLAKDSPLMVALNQAKTNLALAKQKATQSGLDLQTKLTYYYKLTGDAGVATAITQFGGAWDKQAVAQKAYDDFFQNHPGFLPPAANDTTPDAQAYRQVSQNLKTANNQIKTAQERLDLAHQVQTTYTADFTAAYAQSYANQMDVKLQQGKDALTPNARKGVPASVITQRQNDLALLQINDTAAHEVANQLSANAGVADAMLNVSLNQAKVNALQPLATAQQAVTTAQNTYDSFLKTHPNLATAPPTPAEAQQAAKLLDDLNTAKANLAAAQGTYKTWAAANPNLAPVLDITQAGQINDAFTTAKSSLSTALNQQKVAIKDQLMTQFQNSLPDEYKTMDWSRATPEQKQAYSDLLTNFFNAHPNELAGGIIAGQQGQFNNGNLMTWGKGGQISGPTDFRNTVGLAMDPNGAKPSYTQGGNPNRQQDWFAGNQNVDKVMQSIHQVGGKQPNIAIETDVVSEGLTTVNLVKVKDQKTGEMRYIDSDGVIYNSKEDFLQHSQYYKGSLYSAAGMNQDGTFKVTAGDAHHLTFQQWLGHNPVVENINAHSTELFAAGIALDIAAPILAATVVGAPIAAVLELAGTALTLTAMGAGALSAISGITDRFDTHGGKNDGLLSAQGWQSINPVDPGHIGQDWNSIASFVQGKGGGPLENPLNMENFDPELTAIAMAGGFFGKLFETGVKLFTEANAGQKLMSPLAQTLGSKTLQSTMVWKRVDVLGKLANHAAGTAFITQTTLAGMQTVASIVSRFQNHPQNWEQLKGDLGAAWGDVMQFLQSQAFNILFMTHGPGKSLAVRKALTGKLEFNGETFKLFTRPGSINPFKLFKALDPHRTNVRVWDNTLKVWDAATKRIVSVPDPLNGTLSLATPESPVNPVRIGNQSVMVQPDGTLMVSGQTLMAGGKALVLDKTTLGFEQKTEVPVTDQQGNVKLDKNGDPVTRTVKTTRLLDHTLTLDNKGNLLLDNQAVTIDPATGELQTGSQPVVTPQTTAGSSTQAGNTGTPATTSTATPSISTSTSTTAGNTHNGGVSTPLQSAAAHQAIDHAQLLSSDIEHGATTGVPSHEQAVHDQTVQEQLAHEEQQLNVQRNTVLHKNVAAQTQAHEVRQTFQPLEPVQVGHEANTPASNLSNLLALDAHQLEEQGKEQVEAMGINPQVQPGLAQAHEFQTDALLKGSHLPAAHPEDKSGHEQIETQLPGQEEAGQNASSNRMGRNGTASQVNVTYEEANPDLLHHARATGIQYAKERATGQGKTQASSDGQGASSQQAGGVQDFAVSPDGGHQQHISPSNRMIWLRLARKTVMRPGRANKPDRSSSCRRLPPSRKTEAIPVQTDQQQTFEQAPYDALPPQPCHVVTSKDGKTSKTFTDLQNAQLWANLLGVEVQSMHEHEAAERVVEGNIRPQVTQNNKPVHYTEQSPLLTTVTKAMFEAMVKAMSVAQREALLDDADFMSKLLSGENIDPAADTPRQSGLRSAVQRINDQGKRAALANNLKSIVRYVEASNHSGKAAGITAGNNHGEQAASNDDLSDSAKREVETVSNQRVEERGEDSSGQNHQHFEEEGYFRHCVAHADKQAAVAA
jgi:hypothetical protein